MEPRSKQDSTRQQYVVFEINTEFFAIDVMKVRGVERMTEITEIPDMPDMVEGVAHLRGAVIPVVDLVKKFFPRLHGHNSHDKETRIILVELSSRNIVGMIVRQVHEVIQIDSETLGDIPRLATGAARIHQNYIKGVTRRDGRLIIVLDVEKIFTYDELNSETATDVC